MRIPPDNKTHVLRDAIIAAAKQHAGGVLGYLRELAIADPDRFARLLTQALVLETTHPVASDEAHRELKLHMYKIWIEEMQKNGLSDEQIAEIKKIKLNLLRNVPPRKSAPEFREAIVIAAKQVGEDGRGRNRLNGYVNRLRLKHRRAFDALIARLFALEPTGLFEESANMINPEEIERQENLSHEEFLEILRHKGWLDAYRGYSEEDFLIDKSQ